VGKRGVREQQHWLHTPEALSHCYHSPAKVNNKSRGSFSYIDPKLFSFLAYYVSFSHWMPQVLDDFVNEMNG
jgi:hypothetical protein